MNKVKANLVKGWSEAKNPGDYWFINKNGKEYSLMFVCPCGCKAIGGVKVQNDGERLLPWEWNGSRESPTIRPSILRSGGDSKSCTYHGFLTDGIFESC